MKFSIGDKVAFKHTKDEGIVTAYINKEMVEVEVHGVTFPVHIDEIDHPYLKWFTEKKIQPQKKYLPEQLPVEKEKTRKQRLASGVYLSFMPVYKTEAMEDIVDHLKVYLLNELPDSIQYKYEFTLQQAPSFTHEAALHAFGNVFLHNVPYDSMNDQPRFNWWLDDTSDADMAPANGQLRIKPQKLFQHINDCMTNNTPSFNYLLIEGFKPHPAVKPVISVQDKPESKQTTEPTKSKNVSQRHVVDLHIEELVDHTRGMSNADMLIIQLAALKDALREAMSVRQERLIVIHGLGSGKLRDEVHHILDETAGIKSYNNDWKAAYGFGATEVWFEY